MYRNLRDCIADLLQAGQLVRFAEPISATLEAAEMQRRLHANQGPAVLYENVVGCRFPMVSNLFGTLERARYLFRHTLPPVRRLVALKTNPAESLRQPMRSLRALPAALHTTPRRCSRGPVLSQVLTIDQLPQLKSWPDDGGAFITLPQVYTEDILRPGMKHSNFALPPSLQTPAHWGHPTGKLPVVVLSRTVFH